MSNTPPIRKPYPSDVSDEDWAFVVPSLALVREDAPQRRHDLREVLNGLRWLVRTGAEWRPLPRDFPRRDAVYQQARRWLDAGVFEAIGHDPRTPLRLDAGRAGQPSAAILDSKTLQSPPESGGRAGYDGHERRKRRKGSKPHAAGDTRGHLLALRVTPAAAQDRAQVEALAAAVQEATGEAGELAYVDRGDTGDEPAGAAAPRGLRLEVVERPAAKHGFVLLPKRGVVERGCAWAARLRRLARPLAPAGPRRRAPAPGPGGACPSAPSPASCSIG